MSSIFSAPIIPPYWEERSRPGLMCGLYTLTTLWYKLEHKGASEEDGHVPFLQEILTVLFEISDDEKEMGQAFVNSEEKALFLNFPAGRIDMGELRRHWPERKAYVGSEEFREALGPAAECLGAMAKNGLSPRSIDPVSLRSYLTAAWQSPP